MNVLKVCPALLGQGRRDEHVVQFLSVHVEEIGVALELVLADYLV